MKILDDSQAATIADEIISTLEYDGGYTFEEIVPGLIQAVIEVARRMNGEEQVLDEAANFLADGGLPPELTDEDLE